MPLVMPWLLRREYRQHYSLDPEGLPSEFEAWQSAAVHNATRLAAESRAWVVKMVVHPAELESWARRSGRVVDHQVRLCVAEALWSAQAAVATRRREPRQRT